MTAGPLGMYPLLAVHISDGVLTWPWLVGGYLVAAVLAGGAMVKVRDEEIPRIALMTAAFFVASLIHVVVGPTSVHLLLNGLLGVVIGRRAPLAVLIGLVLQFALFAHGGYTTIGVNTCVMALPALGAAWLFGVLRAGSRWAWFRGGLVAVSVILWVLCLVYSVALLWLSRSTGLQDIAWLGALLVAVHPITLAVTGVLAAAAVLVERRLHHPSEFPAGLFVGMTAVLATLALNAAVLLWGGAEDWHSIVLLVFVVHMPIAVVEGLILGFAVGFLARVKPEMLAGLSGGDPLKRWQTPPMPSAANGAIANGAVHGTVKPSVPAGVTLPPPALLLLAVLGMLWAAGPVQAHRLEADYRVRPDGQVQVESWFDVGGKAPAGAKVQVLRPNGGVLAEGALSEDGVFVFRPKQAEDVKVVVSAGTGHRAEIDIPASALPLAPGAPVAAAGPAPPPKPLIDHSFQVPYREIIAGFGFLLGLAAFVLSLRNMKQLQELKRAQEARRAVRADDGHFSAGKTSSSGTSH